MNSNQVSIIKSEFQSIVKLNFDQFAIAICTDDYVNDFFFQILQVKELHLIQVALV